MNIIKRAALFFAKKDFCRRAIEEQADLSGLREKPTMKMIIGIVLIVFSYLIGLPSVIALGLVAIWSSEPLVVIIGGPLIYLISVLVFIVGVHMAGRKHFRAVLRWASRVILIKILGKDACAVSGSGSDNTV